jgi:eukaryotic-like serine/threonine-protein kinase
MKETPSRSDQAIEAAAMTAAPEPPASAGIHGGGEDLAPGTLVGEYRVEQELGRGGMGVVYAARHPVIGKRVAIKVLASQLCNDPALVRRFVDEARAVNKIGHQNIVDIFAFGQLGGPNHPRHYFVMEYLDGETLAARLAREPGIPDGELCRLLVQTADALEAAHRERIVHRDLKPENLWIAKPRHGLSFIKVLDFGIAKLLELTGGRNVTEAGSVIGTPHFMAPEQCLGESVDHRADIYAFGVLLYQAFARKLPFEGRTFAEIVAQKVTGPARRPSALRPLPSALDDLIVACLDKDPAKRPQSAAEVGRRLASALSPAASAASPSPRRNRRLLVAVAVAAAVVGLVTLVVSRWANQSAPVVPAPATAPASARSAPTATHPEPEPATATPPATAPAPVPAPANSERRRPGRAGAPERARAGSRVPTPSRVDERGLVKENPFAQ